MINAMVTFSATVVTAWMLFDASRKRVDTYWYFIILTPMGEWVYFFAVKIHDYDLTRLRKLVLFERPPPVAALRRELEETPSMLNRVRLAEGLYREKHYDEAIALFGEVLAHDEDDKDALYGLAMSELERGQPANAVEHLTRLVEVEPGHGDYEPWFELAFAHWQLDERDRAIDVLGRLVATSPRIKHKTIFGKYLTRAGELERARVVLDEALQDYQDATGFIRRTSGRWAREARDTLAELKREERGRATETAG